MFRLHNRKHSNTINHNEEKNIPNSTITLKKEKMLGPIGENDVLVLNNTNTNENETTPAATVSLSLKHAIKTNNKDQASNSSSKQRTSTIDEDSNNSQTHYANNRTLLRDVSSQRVSIRTYQIRT